MRTIHMPGWRSVMAEAVAFVAEHGRTGPDVIDGMPTDAESLFRAARDGAPIAQLAPIYGLTCVVRCYESERLEYYVKGTLVAIRRPGQLVKVPVSAECV